MTYRSPSLQLGQVQATLRNLGLGVGLSGSSVAPIFCDGEFIFPEFEIGGELLAVVTICHFVGSLGSCCICCPAVIHT